MCEDDLRREAVEIADDDLPPRPRMPEHRAQALLEVRAGAFREGQRENALVRLEEPDLVGGAVRQDLRLATTWRGDNQQMILGRGGGGELFRAELKLALCWLSSLSACRSRAALPICSAVSAVRDSAMQVAASTLPLSRQN